MMVMAKYGETSPDEREERFSPFTELCKFAEEYDLVIEIDKPFIEFSNLLLKVVRKSDGEEVKRITLNDISSVDEESARLLNELSRKTSSD